MIKKTFKLFMLSFCVSVLFSFSAEASTVDSLNAYLTQLQFSDYYSTEKSPSSTGEAGAECVSSANGGLSYVKTDLTLPGKAGFDLNLTRRINSSLYVDDNNYIQNVNVVSMLYRDDKRESSKYAFKYYIDGDKTTDAIYIAYDTISEMYAAENGTNQITLSSDYASTEKYTFEAENDEYVLGISAGDSGMTLDDSFYLYSELPLGDSVVLVRDVQLDGARIVFESIYNYDFNETYTYMDFGINGGWTYDFPRLIFNGRVEDGSTDEGVWYIEYYSFHEPETGRVFSVEYEYFELNTGRIKNSTGLIYCYNEVNGRTQKTSVGAYDVSSEWMYSDEEKDITIINDKGVQYKFVTNGGIRLYLSEMIDRYGNKILIDGDEITDTLGRKILIDDGIYVNGKKVVDIEYIRENNSVVDPRNKYTQDDTDYFKVSNLNESGEKEYGTTTYCIKYDDKKWYTSINTRNPFRATESILHSYIDNISLPTGATTKYEYRYSNVDNDGVDVESDITRLKERKKLVSARWDEVDGTIKNKTNYSYDFSDKDNKCTTVTYDARPGYITKEYYDEDDFLIKSSVECNDEGNTYHVVKEYKNIISSLGSRVPEKITTTTYGVAEESANVIIEEYQYDNKDNVVQTKRDGVIIQKAEYNSYNLPVYEFKRMNDGYFGGIYNTFTNDGKSISKSSVAGRKADKATVTQYDYTSQTYNANGDVASVTSKGVTTAISYTYTSYNDTNSLESSLKKTYTVTSVPTISASENDAALKSNIREEIYDYLGRVVSSKDAKGNATTYEYDGRNNVTKITNPDESIITNEYDYINNTMISTDEMGKKVKYEYDPLGFDKRAYLYDGEMFIPVVERNYDLSCNLKEILLLNEDSSVKGKSSFEYYSDKTPSSEILYEGDTIKGKKEYRSYPYYQDNSSMKETRVFINEDDYVTLSQYTDKYGYKTSDTIMVDDNLYQQTYVTDYLGNVISSRDFRMNAEELEGNSIEYTYDYAGRVLTEKNPSGTITNTYNNNTGLLTKVTDAKGNVTSYSYDKMGRVKSETSDERRVDYFYDEVGNIAQTRVYTDEDKYNVTKNLYDNRSRLIASAISPKEGTQEVVRYSYDLAGNIISAVQGLSSLDEKPSANMHRITEYQYDVYGNLVSETDILGHTEEYTYDLHKNLIQSKDKNGTVFTYTYDIMSRPLSKSYTAEDGETDSVSYTYDMLGNMLSMIDNQGEILYNYDELGNMLSEISGSTSKTYTYDSNGNMLSYQLSTDDEVKQNITYSYDLSNRVAQITDGTVVTAYTYDANGNILTENVKDGTITKKSSVFEYNASNLPTYKKVTTGSDYEEYNMTYDLMGNMLTVTTKTYDDKSKSSSTDSVEYTYDGANRLTKEEYSDRASIVYTYDNRGNMTKKVSGDITSVYTYDKNNRLVKCNSTQKNSDIENTTEYFYDYNGNLVSKIASILNPPPKLKSTLFEISQDSHSMVSLYKYDKWNRLSKASTDKGEATYTYRGDNLRDSKTVVKDGESETTTFVYNGMDIVYEANDDISNTYSRGLLGITFRTDEQNQQSFFRTNQHGDVSSITDTEGNLLTNYQYDAYGNIISDILENDTNPFAYCGEYLDKETGLIYLRNRYYDPEVGRFITQDPIKDGLNWYSYCGGNPVIFVDPWGLKWIPLRETVENAGGTVTYKGEGSATVSVNGYDNLTFNSGDGYTIFADDEKMYVDDLHLYNVIYAPTVEKARAYYDAITDDYGKFILRTWFFGGGKDVNVNSERWTLFMKENKYFKERLSWLIPQAISDGTYTFTDVSNLNLTGGDGGYSSGVELINGANMDAGGCVIIGKIIPQDSEYLVNIKFEFNDIIDPNNKYRNDRYLSMGASLLGAKGTDYKLKISGEYNFNYTPGEGIN